MGWQTVRHDPTYEEKIDEDILVLGDALFAIGFTPTGSCAGHGCWPYVMWGQDVSDARSEEVAASVLNFRQATP